MAGFLHVLFMALRLGVYQYRQICFEFLLILLDGLNQFAHRPIQIIHLQLGDDRRQPADSQDKAG